MLEKFVWTQPFIFIGVKAFNLDTKRGLIELSRFGFLDATNAEEIAYFLFHEGRSVNFLIGILLTTKYHMYTL